MLVKVTARIVCVFVFLLSCVAKAGNMQPVYSLKNLGLISVSSGATYSRTEVKCNTRSERAYILNKKNSKRWCVEGNETACFDDRIEAASFACVNDIIAVEKGPTEAELTVLAQRQELEQELLLTQEKKIQIKERQLELQRKELKLIELRGDS